MCIGQRVGNTIHLLRSKQITVCFFICVASGRSMLQPSQSAGHQQWPFNCHWFLALHNKFIIFGSEFILLNLARLTSSYVCWLLNAYITQEYRFELVLFFSPRTLSTIDLVYFDYDCIIVKKKKKNRYARDACRMPMHVVRREKKRPDFITLLELLFFCNLFAVQCSFNRSTFNVAHTADVICEKFSILLPKGIKELSVAKNVAISLINHNDLFFSNTISPSTVH